MTDKALRDAILKLKPVSIDRIAFAERNIKRSIETHGMTLPSGPKPSTKQIGQDLIAFENALFAFQLALTNLASIEVWDELKHELEAGGLPTGPLFWINRSLEWGPLREASEAARKRLRANPKRGTSKPTNTKAQLLAMFIAAMYHHLTDKRPPIGLEHNRTSAFGRFIADVFECASERGDPAYYADYAARQWRAKG